MAKNFTFLDEEFRLIMESLDHAIERSETNAYEFAKNKNFEAAGYQLYQKTLLIELQNSLKQEPV